MADTPSRAPAWDAEKKEVARQKLAMLRGDPPGNPVHADEHYARHLVREYGMPLHELEAACGFTPAAHSGEREALDLEAMFVAAEEEYGDRTVLKRIPDRLWYYFCRNVRSALAAPSPRGEPEPEAAGLREHFAREFESLGYPDAAETLRGLDLPLTRNKEYIDKTYEKEYLR